MQTTAQQVDGAVAEYECRRERLAELEAEAESILLELSRQILTSRQAAAQAKAKARRGDQPDSALTLQPSWRQIEEDLATLERHRDEQERHLREIQRQRDDIQATLDKLHVQRDLLKTRLRSAEKRLTPEGRKRVTRYRQMLALLAVLAVAAVLAWWIVPRRGESPTGLGAGRVESDFEAAPAAPEGKAAASARGPAAVLLDSLVLYLTFEPETFERVGYQVVVKDLSGHGNHGLVYGPRATENGQVGHCLSLDGIGDYIRFPTLLNTEMEENEAFTLSVWVRDTTYKENACILDGVYPPARGPQLARHARGRKFAFVGPLSITECSAGGFGTQKWHHVVGVWDRSGTLLFVNGKLVGQEGGREFRYNWAARKPEPCVIVGCRGEQAFETYFAGEIDELLMFNRALTQDEVETLYRAGSQGTRPEPPATDPPLGDLPTGEELDHAALARHQREMERRGPPFSRGCRASRPPRWRSRRTETVP
jgi:hypothetical protein